VVARTVNRRDAMPGALTVGTMAAGTVAATIVQPLVHGSGIIATAFIAAGGLLLIVRRFAGAIPAAAEPAVLLAATLVAAVLVLMADASVRCGAVRSLATLARCGLAAGAAALLAPPRATTAMEWAAVAAAATIVGAMILRDPLPRPRAPRVRGSAPRHPRFAGEPRGGTRDAVHPGSSNRRPGAAAPATAPDVATFAPELLVEGLLRQRLERRETTDGGDTLAGLLTITIPTGARLASGYVGFCPSFRQLPTVDVTTEYDGVEAVVAVGDLVPWGVRIDCRLAEPAEEDLEIPVMLTARVEG